MVGRRWRSRAAAGFAIGIDRAAADYITSDWSTSVGDVGSDQGLSFTVIGDTVDRRAVAGE